MKDLMKEKINQLEDLLREVTELIEQHKEIEQIDLDEFDRIQKNNPFPVEGHEEYVNTFRQTIEWYKNDSLFYNSHVPQLELLLSNALKKLPTLTDNLSELKPISKNDKPSPEIIELIKQKILSTELPINGNMNGKTVSGFLTEDGYLELNINGIKKKFGSLRWAAFEVWRKILQESQWSFWKVKFDGLEKPLEDFRKLIK
jgi:hypothetical protein